MHSSGSMAQSHGPAPDRDCAVMLPRVCELLAASGSALPDDTSLEKLLDWFTQLSKAGSCLHENFPCLLHLVSSVAQNASADSAVIAFMMRLSGLMGSTDAGFQTLQEQATLDGVFNVVHWQELRRWDDPSVKSGWLHGLRSMMQNLKALSFFIQSDLMKHLLQLQDDSSLFVASSANQLLTHVLLFYQPEPPEPPNGHTAEGGPRHGDGTEAAFPNANYQTFVKATSEHLRQSLCPEEQWSLQRSTRLLRLVAQILSGAFPCLRAHIFEAVCGSLEDLVSAGDSQLTLPLMEVVLAAHSVSRVDEPLRVEPRLERLLCGLLAVRPTSERTRAASALLQTGFCDSVHAPKAARVLLLPLDVVTGQSVLCSLSQAEDRRQIQDELHNNKSLCTSVVCTCLSNAHLSARLSAEVQPCRPGLIVSAVVTLLHVSTGGFSPAPGCAQTNPHIYGNGRIQKCALDALVSLSDCSDVFDKATDVCSVLLLCLNQPHSDSMMLHKSYQALLKWTSSGPNQTQVSARLQQDLLQVVQKRVCDLRWEVRDSTVEFLGRQAAQSSVDPSQTLLLEEHSTLPLLQEALQDQESYVRASAVCALAFTLQRSWQQETTLSPQQWDVPFMLLNVLRSDTEVFSRRAMLHFFSLWFSHSARCPAAPLRSVLALGSADPDWEVKVRTLELAELLVDRTLSGCPVRSGHPDVPVPPSSAERWGSEDALSELVENGVISALLDGAMDCDRPVAFKACQLLLKLREALDKVSEKVTCGLPSRGWGQELRAVLENVTESGQVSVYEVLRCLRLEERLDVLGRSSDHVQNSPLSLLKDILTTRDVHKDLQALDVPEVIVDCY